MVESILAARQLPCNEINNEISIKKSNNRLQDIESWAVIDEISNRRASISYFSFYSVQKIIHNLLSYNRIVLLPGIIPKLTESELVKKLNITTTQLRHLQKSPKFYKGIAKYICLPLADLYCSSVLQQPESLHTQKVGHE